jgi:hypothetical protein
MDQIKIYVTDDLTLDAGSIEETGEQFVTHPPDTPMIDQLFAYLDQKPEHYRDIQIQHQGVGLTALCVRWGSYLATLMDAAADPHPAISGFHKQQPAEYSFISDAEMKRMNIEISYNLYRVVQVFREQGNTRLWDLLNKAYAYLPMPHKRMPKNQEATHFIFASMATGAYVITRSERSEGSGMVKSGSNGDTRPAIRRVEREDADRFLANVLTCHAWRNTVIEDIHAGKAPTPPLKPHEQRFTKSAQLAVMREVTANMGSVLFMLDPLFDPTYSFEGLPVWPQTATAMANNFYGMSAWNWTLTGSSSPVTLYK